MITVSVFMVAIAGIRSWVRFFRGKSEAKFEAEAKIEEEVKAGGSESIPDSYFLEEPVLNRQLRILNKPIESRGRWMS